MNGYLVIRFCSHNVSFRVDNLRPLFLMRSLSESRVTFSNSEDVEIRAYHQHEDGVIFPRRQCQG